jgi:hypothetical protein
MSSQDSNTSPDSTLVSIRTMDIVVALLLIALASVFMFDSWRVGFAWIEGQGPGPGFFPFYVSLILALASLVSLVRAALGSGPRETFVSTTAFRRVLLVLLPTTAFVALIQYLGIYVSSAIFIFGFMLAFREHVLKAVMVGIAAPLVLFLMFEQWFLVPLPKGPIEAMLGY